MKEKLNLTNRKNSSANKSLVSIIVSTYNQAFFVADMIESVRSQTFSDWELIIIDDGSTDNTQQIVKPYISEKILYYKLKHTGRSYARNYGLKVMKGDFIAFLDSDDIFLPTKLEKQVKWLKENPSTAMVYTSALMIDDNGDFYPTTYNASNSGNIYEKVGMYLPVIITLPSVMVRKEIQDVVGGFDLELDRFEDTDMWRRISRDYKIDALSEPLIKVRTHSSNRLASLDPEKLYKDIIKYTQKVKHEDGKKHRFFVAKGSARLFLHYGFACSRVPGWKKWSNIMVSKAFLHQPFFTLVWLGKKWISELLYRK